MSHRTVSTVIVATLAALLGVWLGALPAAKRAFARQPVVVVPEHLQGAPENSTRPLVAAGVLLVFLANIATLGLFAGSLFSRRLSAQIPALRMPVPRAVNVAGVVLFIANGVWGTLALVFNPGYAPFFLKTGRPIRVATKGPYAIVRHPRYAGEASLNVILAAFTGTWLPLVGILGWPAMREQARIEEEHLMRVAPAAYGSYMRNTGRFLPRSVGPKR